MKKKKETIIMSKPQFWTGILWFMAIFVSYHWYNKLYYFEKFSVFIGHLKSMIG